MGLNKHNERQRPVDPIYSQPMARIEYGDGGYAIGAVVMSVIAAMLIANGVRAVSSSEPQNTQHNYRAGRQAFINPCLISAISRALRKPEYRKAHQQGDCWYFQNWCCIRKVPNSSPN